MVRSLFTLVKEFSPMLRTSLCAASAFALIAVGGLTAAAQPPARPGVAERTADTRTGTAVRAKQILGTRVSIRGGTAVGTVDDIVLSNEGVVDYLIVAHEGKLVTVPWDATKFDYEKRAATVDITQEQYRTIPTYTTERYPNFYAPAYRTEVYRYYGLTPGQGRRLERRR